MKLFIVRTVGPAPSEVEVVLARQTPAVVRTEDGQRDYFCLAAESAFEELNAAGWNVVAVKDGWYDDDRGGGLAVWGNGRYFELRDTLFTVRQG